MNVRYKDYLVKQSEHSDRFHLCQIVTKQVKDSEETYESEKDIGYDMRFESCIQKIILLELDLTKKTVDLKTFLNRYNKERELLLKQINLN